MTLQHSIEVLTALGDQDLAKTISGVQGVFQTRHPGMTDISLPSQVSPPQISTEADQLTVLDYPPKEIAYRPDQIIPGTTRAYMGSLVHYDAERRIIPIFDRLQGIEIYSSRDRKIQRQFLEIDGRLAGKSAEQVLREFRQVGISVDQYAMNILRRVRFIGNSRIVELIWLTGNDLGFTDIATTRDIFTRGHSLGLEICNEEVGPYLILAGQDQPMYTQYFIAMNRIIDRDGGPHVFSLIHDADGLRLHGSWVELDQRWNPDSEFVFSLPQKTQNP